MQTISSRRCIFKHIRKISQCFISRHRLFKVCSNLSWKWIIQEKEIKEKNPKILECLQIIGFCDERFRNQLCDKRYVRTKSQKGAVFALLQLCVRPNIFQTDLNILGSVDENRNQYESCDHIKIRERERKRKSFQETMWPWQSVMEIICDWLNSLLKMWILREGQEAKKTKRHHSDRDCGKVGY